MQRLFNGASQQLRGSCRCPHCSSHKAGKAVRGFGGGGVTTSMQPFVTSTFWLTATFTTGMAIDGQLKAKRRDQWNDALEQLNKEVIRHTKENNRRQERCLGAVEGIEEDDVWRSTALDSTPTRLDAGLAKSGSESDVNVGDSMEVKRSHYVPSWSTDASSVERAQHDFGSTPPADSPHLRPTIRRIAPMSTKAWSPNQVTSETFLSLVDPDKPLLQYVQEREQWPSNTAGLTEPPKFLTHGSRYQDSSPELPYWTPKKAEKVGLCTDLLQMNILKRIYKQHTAGRLSNAVAVSEALQTMLLRKDLLSDIQHDEAALFTDLNRIKNDHDVDLTHYRPIGLHLLGAGRRDDQRSRISDHLNEQLRCAFEDSECSRRIERLVRVWDILNARTSVPNRETYEILIAGLSDTGFRDLTHRTILHLRQSKLRPTETTVAIILQHYTRTGIQKWFEYWLAVTLTGRNNGLMLSSLTSMDEAKDMAHVLLEVGAESGRKRIAQQLPPTPMVFAAVIAGVAKFNGVGTALQLYQSMGKSGWPLSMDGLGPLLRQCYMERDYETGKQIWTLVKRLEAETHDALWLHGRQIPSAHLYAVMMAITMQAKDMDEYRALLEEAVAAHPELDSNILRQNRRQLQRTEERNGTVGQESASEESGETQPANERFDAQLDLLHQLEDELDVSLDAIMERQPSEQRRPSDTPRMSIQMSTSELNTTDELTTSEEVPAMELLHADGPLNNPSPLERDDEGQPVPHDEAEVTEEPTAQSVLIRKMKTEGKPAARHVLGQTDPVLALGPWGMLPVQERPRHISVNG